MYSFPVASHIVFPFDTVIRPARMLSGLRIEKGEIDEYQLSAGGGSVRIRTEVTRIMSPAL